MSNRLESLRAHAVATIRQKLVGFDASGLDETIELIAETCYNSGLTAARNERAPKYPKVTEKPEDGWYWSEDHDGLTIVKVENGDVYHRGDYHGELRTLAFGGFSFYGPIQPPTKPALSVEIGGGE